MAWFRRRRSSARGGARAATTEEIRHLEEFARARTGVEAFVEPRTTVTPTTVLLVAHDGEWTRRRIAGPEEARRLGGRLAIPVYDVDLVGYPNRMREYNARRKRAQS